MSFFFPFLIPFLKAEKRYGTQVERSDWKYNAKYKNIAANTIWLCLQTGLQLCTLGLYQWSLSPLHSDSSAQPLPFDLHRVWRGWVPQAAQAPWEIRRWSWVTHPYSLQYQICSSQTSFCLHCGHAHVPKDEPAEKNTSLAEQRGGTQGKKKKGSLWPLEEGEGNSGGLQGCHGVMQGKN